ncbi:MAG: hypothetical protein DCF16_08285 [Alphaproteobacteria bacterium]|nr:MAG: hypothetical protein DCF16_08285 [Alphaproteobacteria bacterium]
MKYAIAAMSAVAVLWTTPIPAVAQEAAAPTTPQALEAVYACASETDQARRLACYDSAVSALRGAQTSGEVVAIDRGDVARMQRDSFGFNLPSIGRLLPQIGHDDNVVDRVEVTVARMSVGASGRTTFRMEDGQVWTQVDPERVYNVRVGDIVTIRRASIGSFMISSPRGGAGIRVRRAE